MQTLLAWRYCIKVDGILLARLKFRELYAAGSRYFGSTQVFEIESGGHCLGSSIDNCPHYIEFSVWAENSVIKRSAANGATGILWFWHCSTTASTCYTGRSEERRV